MKARMGALCAAVGLATLAALGTVGTASAAPVGGGGDSTNASYGGGGTLPYWYPCAPGQVPYHVGSWVICLGWPAYPY